MKKKKSFKHNSNQRNQDAIMRLRIAHGAAGYGIYLMLVEQLYETGKPLDAGRLDILAYELHCAPEEVKAVVKDFGLFVLTTEGYVLPDMIEPESEEEDPELEVVDPEFQAMDGCDQIRTVITDEELYNRLADDVGDFTRLDEIVKYLTQKHKLLRTNYPNRAAMLRAIRQLRDKR